VRTHFAVAKRLGYYCSNANNSKILHTVYSAEQVDECGGKDDYFQRRFVLVTMQIINAKRKDDVFL